MLKPSQLRRALAYEARFQTRDKKEQTMLSSDFDPNDHSWRWKPPGDEEDWERCNCCCHKPGMNMYHVMACCQGGWKPTFRLLGKRMREAVAAELASRQVAVSYKPAHGGYPDAR